MCTRNSKLATLNLNPHRFGVTRLSIVHLGVDVEHLAEDACASSRILLYIVVVSSFPVVSRFWRSSTNRRRGGGGHPREHGQPSLHPVHPSSVLAARSRPSGLSPSLSSFLIVFHTTPPPSCSSPTGMYVETLRDSNTLKHLQTSLYTVIWLISFFVR